jgi:hypothetical protein
LENQAQKAVPMRPLASGLVLCRQSHTACLSEFILKIAVHATGIGNQLGRRWKIPLHPAYPVDIRRARWYEQRLRRTAGSSNDQM